MILNWDWAVRAIRSSEKAKRTLHSITAFIAITKSSLTSAWIQQSSPISVLSTCHKDNFFFPSLHGGLEFAHCANPWSTSPKYRKGDLKKCLEMTHAVICLINVAGSGHDVWRTGDLRQTLRRDIRKTVTIAPKPAPFSPPQPSLEVPFCKQRCGNSSGPWEDPRHVLLRCFRPGHACKR